MAVLHGDRLRDHAQQGAVQGRIIALRRNRAAHRRTQAEVALGDPSPQPCRVVQQREPATELPHARPRQRIGRTLDVPARRRRQRHGAVLLREHLPDRLLRGVEQLGGEPLDRRLPRVEAAQEVVVDLPGDLLQVRDLVQLAERVQALHVVDPLRDLSRAAQRRGQQIGRPLPVPRRRPLAPQGIRISRRIPQQPAEQVDVEVVLGIEGEHRRPGGEERLVRVLQVVVHPADTAGRPLPARMGDPVAVEVAEQRRQVAEAVALRGQGELHDLWDGRKHPDQRVVRVVHAAKVRRRVLGHHHGVRQAAGGRDHVALPLPLQGVGPCLEHPAQPRAHPLEGVEHPAQLVRHGRRPARPAAAARVAQDVVAAQRLLERQVDTVHLRHQAEELLQLAGDEVVPEGIGKAHREVRAAALGIARLDVIREHQLVVPDEQLESVRVRPRGDAPQHVAALAQRRGVGPAQAGQKAVGDQPVDVHAFPRPPGKLQPVDAVERRPVDHPVHGRFQLPQRPIERPAGRQVEPSLQHQRAPFADGELRRRPHPERLRQAATPADLLHEAADPVQQAARGGRADRDRAPGRRGR